MFSRHRSAVSGLGSTFASRSDLLLENLALRQQLAVLRRKHPRPLSFDRRRNVAIHVFHRVALPASRTAPLPARDHRRHDRECVPATRLADFRARAGVPERADSDLAKYTTLRNASFLEAQEIGGTVHRQAHSMVPAPDIQSDSSFSGLTKALTTKCVLARVAITASTSVSCDASAALTAS